MATAQIEVLGRRFELTAAPYSWVHGVGVTIEIAADGELVGAVNVLGARIDAEYSALAALAATDLCELALSRFLGNELPVTLESVLSWQNKLSAIGHPQVSPLISRFSRKEARSEHAARLTRNNQHH
jgi:hypothetical protein